VHDIQIACDRYLRPVCWYPYVQMARQWLSQPAEPSGDLLKEHHRQPGNSSAKGDQGAVTAGSEA
jgi:hypothetical protein